MDRLISVGMEILQTIDAIGTQFPKNVSHSALAEMGKVARRRRAMVGRRNLELGELGSELESCIAADGVPRLLDKR